MAIRFNGVQLGAALLGLTVALFWPGQARALDDYDLWRRITIDVCQRLPTLEEIACIEANGGSTPSATYSLSRQAPAVTCDVNFDEVVDACLSGEGFAELVALGINDFDLPSASIAIGDADLVYKTATFSDVGQVSYFYARGWGDCLRGVTTRIRAVDELLDKARSPYFASASNLALQASLGASFFHEETDLTGTTDFVYVCKETRSLEGTNDCRSTAAQLSDTYEEAEASLADTAPTVCVPTGATRRQCQRGAGVWPCGCGPNLRWCQLGSALFSEGPSIAAEGNSSATGRWNVEMQAETFQLVKHIVWGAEGLLGLDVPFTEIFTADYSVRTSRLQHLYEWTQSDYRDSSETDECYRQLLGIDKTDASCNLDVALTSVEYVDFDPTTTDGKDWQVVPFDAVSTGTEGLSYRAAGILTHLQLLLRQPSEPNIANRIYSYFTCQDIGWNRWELQSDPDDEGDFPDWLLTTDYEGASELRFSTLFRTSSAVTEPFDEGEDAVRNCRGCHLTVVPLAAFRNFWTDFGRYDPGKVAQAAGLHQTLVTTEASDRYGAKGVFLGKSGKDMTGLGALMARSETVHRCITNRVVGWLTGSMLEQRSEALDALTATFQDSNFDIKALYRAVLSSDEYRRPR